MNTSNRLLTLAVMLLSLVSVLSAQDSADDLSQQAANPVADLMSFPLQNNIDFGLGEFDRSRNVLNFQPVIPFSGGKLITRTVIPFVWLPDITAESGTFSSGISDITFTAFYVLPSSGGLTVGVGPVIDLPTGGDARGSGKWNLGPSAVVLKQTGDWTLGLLVNNVWSVAGDADRADVNRGLIQYFIVRQMGGGWYVNSAPIITVDWQAESGQQWVVPFGIGAGKVAFLGKLPVNIQAGAFVNVVKPDIGPEWQMRLQVQVLLPKSILGG
jgi:hypothetical protein